MIYMYCRQFLTKALRRRDCCLADRERAESERSFADSRECVCQSSTNFFDVVAKDTKSIAAEAAEDIEIDVDIDVKVDIDSTDVDDL